MWLICTTHVWKVQKKEFSKCRAFDTPNKCPRSVSRRMIFLNCVREAKCRLRADVDHINSPSRQRSGTRLLHQSNLVIAGDIRVQSCCGSAKSEFFILPLSLQKHRNQSLKSRSLISNIIPRALRFSQRKSY